MTYHFIKHATIIPSQTINSLFLKEAGELILYPTNEVELFDIGDEITDDGLFDAEEIKTLLEENYIVKV